MRLSVVLDCADPAALVPFWSEAMGYRSATSLPGFEVLVPRADQPEGPVFILQRVPEGKPAKNRMHLDVHVPLDIGVPGQTERLVELGRPAAGCTGHGAVGDRRDLVAGDGRPRGQRVLPRRRPWPPRAAGEVVLTGAQSQAP